MAEETPSSYFDSFTKVPLTLMKILQLNVNQSSQSKTRNVLSKVYYWLIVFFLIFNMVLSAKALMLTDTFDMQKLVMGINLSISLTTVSNKVMLLYFAASQIVEIINELKGSHSIQEQKKYGIENYRKKISKFNKVYSAFWIMPFSIQFISVPLVFIFAGKRTFPLFIEYPEHFNPTSDFMFPIFYAFSIWSLSSPAFAMVAYDLSFYNMLTAISMEFDIVKKDARDIKNLKESEVRENLRKIVIRQDQLFKIVSKIERIFSFSNFYYFLVASIIICLFAFFVSVSNSISEVIPFGSFCISTIYQLYLQCDFGQRLTDASLGVFDGIYDCGWEDFKDVKLKREVIIVMMRSRKAACVTFMGFTDISMQRFTDVSLMC